MAPVGASALFGGLSYVAVGRETAQGTYNTCTAALDCLSASLMTTQDNKIIEQIERSRTYSKRISLMRKISGDLEFYFAPRVDACGFILQNAFGGTVTSVTTTGETTGAGASSAMDHTFNLGMMDQSYPSLCMNIRKGDSLGGKVFQFSGLRVGQINFSANMDDALKCSASFVGMDSTQNSNDVAGSLTVTDAPLLTFVDGRVSVETSFASLTSTSFWHVKSVEFGWNNNLKSDADSGRIGSQILTVLPVGVATFNLKCNIRFDTTTAYDAMRAATKLSVQLEFKGPTLTGSAIRQGIKFNFPTCYINNAGDPSIGGPDQILSSDVDFHVLRDDTSNTGYAIQGVLTNQKTSYA
jgi:hypothetical protein